MPGGFILAHAAPNTLVLQCGHKHHTCCTIQWFAKDLAKDNEYKYRCPSCTIDGNTEANVNLVDAVLSDDSKKFFILPVEQLFDAIDRDDAESILKLGQELKEGQRIQLLESFCEVEYEDGSDDRGGETPLTRAIFYNKINALQAICGLMQDLSFDQRIQILNTYDSYDRTPLFTAAYKENLTALQAIGKMLKDCSQDQLFQVLSARNVVVAATTNQIGIDTIVAFMQKLSPEQRLQVISICKRTMLRAGDTPKKAQLFRPLMIWPNNLGVEKI